MQRITTEEAIGMICGLGTVAPDFGWSDDYLEAQKVDETVLARHRMRIPDDLTP